MFDLTQYSFVYTPLGTSILVGIIIIIYMAMMSISVYLPPILLISVIVGYIVYQSQVKYKSK